ncbi:MAG: AAA family ATPase [Gemmataceae bacterium]|nr:AAA family ATPase [Gemmataceae bacterium]
MSAELPFADETPFARALAAALGKDDVDECQRLLAEALSIPRAEADVTRIDDQRQIHKTMWQGEPLRRHFRAELFIPGWSCDQKDIDTIVEAVKQRMAPGPNGFDAVAICQRVGDRWTIGHVVEYAHSPIGGRLQRLLGEVRVEQVVADPAPPVSPPPAPEEYPEPEELLAHLRERPNVVLQGPPGSGKTRLALEAVRLLAGGPIEGCRLDALSSEALAAAPVVWELVQMHPGYAYEDFVRGLATGEGAGLRFVPQDRVFLRMCAAAKVRGTKPTVVILDELNRCDLSAVLGELIAALDSRDGTAVRLQYPPPPGGEAALSVPANLWVVGTMNTADRSTALLDFAVRRRFRFIEVPASPSPLRRFYADHPARGEMCADLLAALGGMVERDGLAPGHSYLMARGPGWAARLARRIAYEAWPLLGEYAREGLLRLTEFSVRGEPWGDARRTPAEEVERRAVEKLREVDDA